MATLALSNRNYFIQSIEITQVPELGNNQEACSAALCNMMSAFMSYISPTFIVELVFGSEAVQDQLSAARVHLCINLYQEKLSDNDPNEADFNTRVITLNTILNNSGYHTLLHRSPDAIRNACIYPKGLVGELYVMTNSETPFRTGSTYIPMSSAMSNLLTFMQYNPDTQVSLLFLRNYEESDADPVFLINIRTMSAYQDIARNLYHCIEQGIERQMQPVTEIIEVGDVLEHWNYRFDVNVRNWQIIKKSDFECMMHLPFGRHAGLPVAERQQDMPTFAPGLINGNGVFLGEVTGYAGRKFTLPLQEKTSNLAVLGVPGSGKSNFLQHYITTMHNDFGVPVMVIDPINSEFRSLIGNLKNGCHVFTPGMETVSPFQFNLFALPTPSITVGQYKTLLKDFMRKSLRTYSPLDYLMDESIDRIYRKYGWSEESTLSCSPGSCFTIRQFQQVFEQVCAEKQYKGEMGNIITSGMSRLNSMLKYFDTEATIPMEDLLSSASLIELSALSTAEAKSILLLFILSQIKSYFISRAKELGGNSLSQRPRLMIVIDEAHTLIGSPIGNNESGNLAQLYLIEMINSILLEMRKYGICMVLADQSAHILKDAMANCMCHIIFKQTDTDSRQYVASTINLDDAGLLARLKTGQCMVKAEQLESPVKITTPLFTPSGQSCTSNEQVAEHMKVFWAKHAGLTRYSKDICQQCKLQICNYRYRQIARDLTAQVLDGNAPDDYSKLVTPFFDGSVPIEMHSCFIYHLDNATKDYVKN